MASLAALHWHVSSSPPEYAPKDGQSFVDPINFQYSAPLFLIKITSKTQTRLIHMWTLPKLSSMGANTCLIVLWTHCCPFTCIYFAWPMAEPWKLENKLLFSKSCQRWPLCQRVDCGTNIPLIRGLFCSTAVSTVTYLSAEAFSLSCLCWKSSTMPSIWEMRGMLLWHSHNGRSARERKSAPLRTASLWTARGALERSPSSCPGLVKWGAEWERAPRASAGAQGASDTARYLENTNWLLLCYLYEPGGLAGAEGANLPQAQQDDGV